jgi:hypothetical protein
MTFDEDGEGDGGGDDEEGGDKDDEGDDGENDNNDNNYHLLGIATSNQASECVERERA